MLNSLRSLFGLKAAAPMTGANQGDLPPPETPKVKPGQSSFPGHTTITTGSTAALPRTDLNLANRSITDSFRFGASTSDTLRSLIRANPDLAAAVSSHLRMGIPERYCAYAYNGDGSFNVDATRIALEILARFDKMPGYDTGFSSTGSIRSLGESIGKEILIEGAGAMELVLDKARLPSAFAPVSTSPTRMRLYDDFSQGTKSLRPTQVVAGQEIDLDIPNFFMVWLDASLIDAYPQPPLEAAIQPVLAASTFLDDLRRVCARHVYPRYVASIDSEKLKAQIPVEILIDPIKLEAYLDQVIVEVKDALDNLAVEEALIIYDFIEVKYIEGQTGDVPATFDTVKEIYDGKIATGARSMPSMLGHGSGSQNIASTETMLALLTSNSMVRLKLQELFSKGLTLACRLFGQDVTVNFEYDEIELRPATEVEAFRAMRQDRIKDQLSMGMISDEEACLRLTGRLPTGNMQALSGTMFMVGALGVDPQGKNAYSGTSTGGDGAGGGATQARQPKTPTAKPGSKPVKK